MKKFVICLLGCAMLFNLTGCGSNKTAATTETVMTEEVTTAASAPEAAAEAKEKTEALDSHKLDEFYPMLDIAREDLAAGSVFVYDFGPVKLHQYRTDDAMGNFAYLVESETGLVTVEMPAFPENLEAWDTYIAGIGKPWDDAFVSSHPAGGSLLVDKNVYGTQAVLDSSQGGNTYSRAQRLSDSNNLNFDEGSDIAKVTEIIDSEYLTVAGITFRIIDHGGSYDVAIPAIHVVLPHQRLNIGNHPTLASIEAMDGTLATLHNYLDSGYGFLFSMHGGPEGPDDIIKRIDYLNTAKKAAGECGSAEEFIAVMQDAFPDYAGLDNLNTSAENLFKTT